MKGLKEVTQKFLGLKINKYKDLVEAQKENLREKMNCLSALCGLLYEL